MRIGVDATCWSLARGFGRHARCLIAALHDVDRVNEYTLFTDDEATVETLNAFGRAIHVRTSMPTVRAAAAGGRRSVRDLMTMSRAMSDRALDVLLFPAAFSYVPVWTRARKVVLFHDVTAERFPELTLDSKASQLAWRLKIGAARRQADIIGTVSEYSKRQLAETFHLDPSKIHVIGEAADPVFQRLDAPALSERLLARGLTPGRRTIVYVGGFSPHKNIPHLVHAFGQLSRDSGFADVDLVLVGDFEHETFFTVFNEVRLAVERAGVESRVRFMGFVPDADLVPLLNLASVLVLPSAMEGFGLPAIEAAACGCPVIATTESPLPELLGAGGVFIDPRQPAALERALRDVLSSPQRQAAMRTAALAAASQLTWPAAARQLITLMTSPQAS